MNELHVHVQQSNTKLIQWAVNTEPVIIRVLEWDHFQECIRCSDIWQFLGVADGVITK